MHSVHTRVPRFMIFMTPVVRVGKKVSENKKIWIIIFDFFNIKNLKNQIILVIIKYNVHAFKCAKNLIIMSLLLI